MWCSQLNVHASGRGNGTAAWQVVPKGTVKKYNVKPPLGNKL